MKKTLLAMMLAVLVVPTAMAAFTPVNLPNSSYYDGYSVFSVDTGDGVYARGRVEYAVYDTTIQAADLGLGESYEGPRFIYAYQVFTYGNSDVAIDYFAVQGIDPSTIANVDDDISAAGMLGSSDSEGVEPENYFFNDGTTEAIWLFGDTVIAQSEKSWFMLIYSDYDYTEGDYTVTAGDNGVVVPGDGLDNGTGDNNVPEPATMAMLIGGALLSLRRKK